MTTPGTDPAQPADTFTEPTSPSGGDHPVPPPTDGSSAGERAAAPQRKRSIWSPGVIVAVAIVAALGVMAGRQLVSSFGPHLYSGTVLQDDTPAPSMDGLTFARTGEPVDLAAHEGEVILVFFGYTNCPDVCPASMALGARAIAGLSEEDQARTEMWMVSVDPGRDTPASLQEYVEFFNPAFEGLSGSAADVDQVTTGYGVFYELEPTAAEGADDYLVDHTASLFGIGPDGSLRIVWPPTVTAEQLQADIEELL